MKHHTEEEKRNAKNLEKGLESTTEEDTEMDNKTKEQSGAIPSGSAATKTKNAGKLFRIKCNIFTPMNAPGWETF